jgi:hypothetical protein
MKNLIKVAFLVLCLVAFHLNMRINSLDRTNTITLGNIISSASASTECGTEQFDDMILDQVTCWVERPDNKGYWGEKMDCISQATKCCNASDQTTCS